MYTCHVRQAVRALVGLAVVAALVLGAPAVARDGKEDRPDTTLKEAVRKLRRAAVEKAPLHGVLIKGAEADGGKLRLKGFVNSAGQRGLLENDIGPSVLSDVPGWKEKFPRGLSAADLDTLPFRDNLLPALQKHFANSTNPDAHQRAILRSTRLDDAYFEDADDKVDRLAFVGACLYLGMPMPPLDLSAPAPPEPSDPAPNVQDVIRKAAEKYIREEFLVKGRVPAKAKKLMPEVSAKGVEPLKGDNNPILLIQKKVVQESGCDDVVCTARYGDDGTLLVEGLVGDPERKEQIAHVLNAQRANYPGLRKVEGEQDRFSIQVKTSEADKWPVSKKWLQQQLTLHVSNSLHRQTRLDRAYLLYDEDGGRMRMWFEGVSCDLSVLDKRGDLGFDLLQMCYSKSPALESYVRNRSALKGIIFINQPRPYVQAAITTDRRLDGTRIDPDAYFDAEGIMCLRGLWTGPDQRKTLEEVAKRALDAKYKQEGWPMLNGRLRVKAEDMVLSGTSDILKALRSFAAKQPELEDVWLDRLYFNRAFNLELTGFGPTANEGQGPPEPDEEEPDEAPTAANDIRKELQKQMNQYPQLKATPLEVGLKGLPVTPSRYLRGLVQKPDDPVWDGVLIERGYYTVDGIYSAVGLVDNAGQPRKLETLLSEFAGKEGAQLFPASGETKWAMDKLEIKPLKPMFDCLKRVMPAYEEFDGIWLERAYHDRQQRLVFLGSSVGRGPWSRAQPSSEEWGAQPKRREPWSRAQPLLKRLLAGGRPEWKRRSAAGVSLGGLKFVERDLAVVDKALGDAFPEILYGMQVLSPSYYGGGFCSSLPGCAVGVPREVGPQPPPHAGAKDTRLSVRKHFAGAISRLDIALLHRPDDSTAWYLRALCYLALGDALLAERDLNRTVKLEKAAPGLVDDRLNKTELFQGDLRTATTKLRDKIFLDPSSYKPLLTMKDCQ